MSESGIARFEAQAAETVGAMKELFEEFEKRLGEVVSVQRLASSEARSEGAKVRGTLEQIAREANAMLHAQRAALTEIKHTWPMHLIEDARTEGREIALSYGEEIAAGLHDKLEAMGQSVERATARLAWLTTLKWCAGIAAGIALTIAIGVWAWVPSVEGLTTLQVRAAMARLAPCRIGEAAHVCVAVAGVQRPGKDLPGAALAVVSGM